MKRGMPSGGHRSPTAFILWPFSPSKKSPLDPPSPWSWLGAYPHPVIRRLQGLKDKRQEFGSLPSGKTTIFRKFRKNRKNGHFLQSLTLKMVGLLQLKLPTSTLVGFLINGLIMNLLQHIFSQAENLVFQFQKSRGRIFCVFPRLLLLQSKSLRPLLTGEIVGRSSETQRKMRKQWILSDAASGPIQPQIQFRK